MIVPFWSWNLSDTTHVRSHTKFQLIWAINTAFSRGGHNVPPPSLKCVAGTPSLLGLNIQHSACPHAGDHAGIAAGGGVPGPGGAPAGEGGGHLRPRLGHEARPHVRQCHQGGGAWSRHIL